VEEQEIPKANSVNGTPDGAAPHTANAIAIINPDFDIAGNTFGPAAAVAQINPGQEEARSFLVRMPSSLYN
jgi:hypothetical protein